MPTSFATARQRIGAALPTDPDTYRFIVAFVLSSMVWWAAIDIIMLDSTYSVNVSEWRGTAVALGVFGVYFVGLGAVVRLIHRRLPTNTVDWYHRLGKHAALFIATNLLVSATILALVFSSPPAPGLDGALIFWALASLLVPGPYIGALLGAQWVNN